MTYAVLLVVLAAMCLPIVLIVRRSQIAKTMGLPGSVFASGLCCAAPWFGLWALARLSRPHCPRLGPCRLDGMQMVGEALMLIATPIALSFGIIIALVLKIVTVK